MNFFDAHSDILTDVTNRRLRGESNVIFNRHYGRLKSSNVEGLILVMWVDPPFDRDYVKRTGQIFKAVTDEFNETKALKLVKSCEEMQKAREKGELYAWLGVEGMAYIENSIERLDEYYNIGARHGMLTWNESNSLGHGAATGESAGLTELGKEVVRRMQKLGMLVDVSHLNEAGFWDIARMSVKPVIASHSNCRSICQAPRNLTDDQLIAIRDLNGVVGINSYRNFIDNDINKSDIDRLITHVDRMINIMGIDHVGLGFDFFEFLGDDSNPDVYSGDDSGCIGLEDCTKINNLFEKFKSLGMTAEEMEKIAYKNFHRVLSEVTA